MILILVVLAVTPFCISAASAVGPSVTSSPVAAPPVTTAPSTLSPSFTFADAYHVVVQRNDSRTAALIADHINSTANEWTQPYEPFKICGNGFLSFTESQVGKIHADAIASGNKSQEMAGIQRRSGRWSVDLWVFETNCPPFTRTGYRFVWTGVITQGLGLGDACQSIGEGCEDWRFSSIQWDAANIQSVYSYGYMQLFYNPGDLQGEKCTGRAEPWGFGYRGCANGGGEDRDGSWRPGNQFSYTGWRFRENIR